MKAAIYCRLSKEDEKSGQGESESIQNQKSMLLRYALEQGYAVYGIYCDEDYSGADRDRPDFNRMLQAAARREFDTILVKTQSRFTRDMELAEKYLHGLFPQWGIRFIAVVDHVDTADAAGKKSRQLNGLINEWYLEDLSSNVRSVLTHKRRAGRYIGAFALYGYQKDPADPGHLVVDPPAAEVVRSIYGMYLAGSGAARIARTLNEQGIPAPAQYKRMQGENYKGGLAGSGQAPWGKATVYRILSNRSYMGDLEQGRHKRLSYKSKKTVWLPRDQWIVAPGTHQPIISPDVFAQVQQMLALHGRSGGGGQVNPLAGKVFCGVCGAGMEQTCSGCRPAGGSARRYFRCRMALRDPGRCGGQPYMPADRLQQLVLDCLCRQLEQCGPPQIAPQWEESLEPVERQAAGRRMQRLQAEIDRRQKAVEQLYLDKSGGAIDEQRFETLRRSFLEQLEQLEKNREALRQKLQQPCRRDPQWLESWRRQLVNPPALRRELVCLLVRKVVVCPPAAGENIRQIEIQWNF